MSTPAKLTTMSSRWPIRSTLLVMSLAVAACIPIFSNGAFQTLKLVFKLSETISADEQRTLHVTAFPQSVKTKKTFVQVSGALRAGDGDSLPSKVKLQAVFENSAGRTVQNISLTLAVSGNGTFRASKKIKKNIGAGDMMTVSLTPTGGNLAKGTEISICVDLVKKKSALADLPACVDAPPDGNGDAAATLTALQNDFFTPTCAQAGCHSSGSASAGLVLAAEQSHGNLVNVQSSQVPSLNRVTPNNPEMSYLIKKLRGDSDISGNRMPSGGTFLSDAEIARISSWINDGAPNN